MNCNEKTTRVFLAIASGVGLGLVIGRELSEFYWVIQWVAPVIGGVFAYLAVDFEQIVAAIPEAWEAVKGSWPTGEEYWEYVKWCVYACLSMGTMMYLVTDGLMFFLPPSDSEAQSLFLSTLIIGFGGGVCIVLMNVMEYKEKADPIGEMQQVVLMVLPPIVIFYHLPRGLWWIVRYGAPQAVSFICRFAWQWFRIIHSSLRTLCFVDAAIFTVAGLIIGGPILAWMVGGGVFGVINYRVVSIKLLKLAPETL